MKRYRIRFHLARGDNYMKWQVFDKQENTKSYFDPDSNSIVMKGCKLGNHPKTAQKIHEGDNKTVCAWVSCDDVVVIKPTPPRKSMTHYKYNPKKNPHWHTETTMNVDNLAFDVMMTHKRRVYG